MALGEGIRKPAVEATETETQVPSALRIQSLSSVESVGRFYPDLSPLCPLGSSPSMASCVLLARSSQGSLLTGEPEQTGRPPLCPTRWMSSRSPSPETAPRQGLTSGDVQAPPCSQAQGCILPFPVPAPGKHRSGTNSWKPIWGASPPGTATGQGGALPKHNLPSAPMTGVSTLVAYKPLWLTEGAQDVASVPPLHLLPLSQFRPFSKHIDPLCLRAFAHAGPS